MAITDWWLGHATETTASVVVRSDATETVTLTVSGGTGDSAAADTSVKDGIVVLTATGLSADASYTFTAGDTSGTLKTYPSSGEFNMCWVSCMERNRTLEQLKAAVNKKGAKFIVAQGDMPYSNGGDNSFGVSTTTTNTDQTLANFHAHYQQVVKNKGLKEACHQVPIYRMQDDHEWPGDDWDHTGSASNDNGALPDITANQAEVDAIWDTGNTAAIAYNSGNPSNSDTDAVAEKPSDHERAADADFAVISAAAANYPVKYCRWTVGNAEFFLIDCISYKSAKDSTDNSSKTMIGAQQKLWLKNQLAASTATFKVILSPKRIWDAPAGSSNSDAWGDYLTEQTEILVWIEANVTGVIWLTGDQHRASISASVKAADATLDIADSGDAYNSVEVNACPIGVGGNVGALTLTSQVRQDFEEASQNYGILKVTSGYVEAQIWRASNNRLVWKGRVLAGTNLLSYEDLQVAI